MNNYYLEMLLIFLLHLVIIIPCMIFLKIYWKKDVAIRTMLLIALSFLATGLILFETIWFLMAQGVPI